MSAWTELRGWLVAGAVALGLALAAPTAAAAAEDEDFPPEKPAAKPGDAPKPPAAGAEQSGGLEIQLVM